MMKRNHQSRPREVSYNEIEESLRNGVHGADLVRADGLEQLAKIKKAKVATLERERTRLSAKLGQDHERVRNVEYRIDQNQRLINEATLESERARTLGPEVGENDWLVHGFVRDREGGGREGLTVGLYREPCHPGESLATTCTDKRGYFEIRRAVSRKEAAAARALRFARTRRTAVYLQVLDKDGSRLSADERPLYPKPGGMDYRELTVERSKAEPEEGEGERPQRYLGNANSLELHDLRNVTPRCGIDAIRPAHRRFIRTQKEATQLGYDFCAYCFGKRKSKR